MNNNGVFSGIEPSGHSRYNIVLVLDPVPMDEEEDEGEEEDEEEKGVPICGVYGFVTVTDNG